MIYTFTPNLAIDLFIETNELEENTVNRTNYFKCSANGKGVNVSLILKSLGFESCILGFKGGFTGQYIEEELARENFKSFIPQVEGITRINIFTKVLYPKREYGMVNPGPEISEGAKNEIYAFLENKLGEGDILSINGSFPEGIDRAYVIKICELCKARKTSLLIDNSSDFVLELCKYRPYLLKPNEFELCKWFGEDVRDKDQFIRLGENLLDLGAENVIVSLGKDGGLFINRDEIIYVSAPKGEVVNTAMAGDSLLGTFLAEKLNKKTNVEALKKAICAGSSTAFREGLTDFSDVSELEKQVYIKRIRRKYEI